MSLATLVRALNTPQNRQLALSVAKKVGRKAVQGMGRSRARRAQKGRWYFGRKVGIPPRRRNPAVGLNAVVTTTRAPNIGQSQKNLQLRAIRKECGTETLGEVVANPSWINNGFGILLDLVVNPADPSTFPALAAIANQYQKFKTGSVRFTFIPSASTSSNGTVYLGFTPDLDGETPTSVADILGMLGSASGPVYGKSTVMPVPDQCVQRAYNIQTIKKSANTGNDSPTNCMGRLFVAVSGWDNEDFQTIGTLSCVYDIQLSTRQLTQGSNALNAVYRAGPIVSMTDLFTPEKLEKGHHMLHALPGGSFALRAPHAQMFMSYRIENGSSDACSLAWHVSADNVNWTELDVTQSESGGVAHGHCILPWARFFRIVPSGLTAANVTVYICTSTFSS